MVAVSTASMSLARKYDFDKISSLCIIIPRTIGGRSHLSAKCAHMPKKLSNFKRFLFGIQWLQVHLGLEVLNLQSFVLLM